MANDEQAIRELVASWHEATAMGDVERVLELMAEDVVFLTAGQAPIRGRQEFAAGLRSLLENFSIRSSGKIQELQISGDLAYCWTFLTVDVLPLVKGDAVRRTGPALTILRRQPDGTWVVFRDANMLAAEPPIA